MLKSLQLAMVLKKNVKTYELSEISRPYGLSRQLIKDFQCIVGRNELTFDVLSKEIVRYSKKIMVKILRDKNLVNADIKVIENALLFILDIIFYAFSLNINSSTTFKVSQTIILLCKFLNNKPQDFRHKISLKIFKEVDFIITNFQNKTKKSETNIESLNLLIALTKIDQNYQFSEDRLRKIFNISSVNEIEKMNYFQIITLIYYINDSSRYNEIRKDIVKSVENVFNKGDDVFSRAEHTMLFFDYISCPFIPNTSKEKVIRTAKFASDPLKIQKEIKNICKHDFWFMDWSQEINLERILKKKEWGYTS